MSLESALFQLISGAPTVAALVGTRVRPLAAAQGERRPFVTYNVRKEPTFDTLGDGPSDYRPAEVELGVYADSYLTAADLSERVQAVLDDCGDTVTAADGSAIEFAPIMFEEETDIEQVVNEGEERPVYLRVQTYRALYKVIPAP